MDASTSHVTRRWRRRGLSGGVVAAAAAILAVALIGGLPPAGDAGRSIWCGDTTLTEAQVARELGVAVQTLRALPGIAGLTDDELCRLVSSPAKVEDREGDHPGETDALGALKFRLLSLVDENGIIPENAMERALEERRLLALASEQADTVEGAGIVNGSWTELGPGNIGGRSRAVLVDPTNTNILLMGGVGGGVWRSTNAGASWVRVNDFMGNLAIGSMAMQPSNHNIVYAGTGEGFGNIDAIRGAGIWKSADNGVSWARLAATATSSFYYVNRIAISPNSAVVLAATNTGIFRSTDAGASWTQVHSGAVRDVDFHPTDSTRAVAGRTDGTALYSVNGGASWTSVTVNVSGGRVEVTCAKANGLYVYASVDMSGSTEYVYLSTNGGASYSYRGSVSLGGQTWYNNVIAAPHPADVSFVLVGGVSMWRSINAGTSFDNIQGALHVDHHAITPHPSFNGTTNQTVYVGNDGGVYRTTNVMAAAPTWTELNNHLGVTQFYGASAQPNGWVVGGTQDNGTLVYKGNYEGWTFTAGGDGGFAAFDQTSSQYCYGEYQNGYLHRSTNSCVSSSGWFDMGSFGGPCAQNDSPNWMAPNVLDPNNANRFLAGARQLWRTTSARTGTCSTFTSIKPSTGSSISAIAIDPLDSNECLVGHNNGDLYRTTNCTAATPSWTKIDPAAMPNRYVADIAVRGSVIFVTFGGFSTGNVWRSTNSGGAWVDVHGTLPAAPVRTVQINPTDLNWIYVGSEVGIFTSQNQGASWYMPHDGPADVSVDELFFVGSSTLYAATHGRGVWRATVSAYGAPPVAATLISPSGTGLTAGQLYRWNSVSNASWYRLWVQNSSGSVKYYDRWLTAAQVGCASGIGSAGVCQFYLPVATAAGTVVWWVDTWNPLGYGPWSAPRTFTASLVAAQVMATWPVPTTQAGYVAPLWAQVRNTGAVALPAGTRVWFKVTGPGLNQWVGGTLVAGLAPGATVWYLYEWDIPPTRTAGTHTYLAQVWAQGPVSVSGSLSRSFTVTAGATYAARVESLWPVGTVVAGTSANLWALVKNTGTAAFPANTNVWYWVRGPGIDGWVGSTAASGLAPGAVAWYKTTWAIPSTQLPGSYTYWAQVWRYTTTWVGMSPWSSPQGFEVTVHPPGTDLRQDTVTNSVPGPDAKAAVKRE